MSGRAVLMGMGITGRAVAQALTARGHDVAAFDDRADSHRDWSDRTGIPVQRPGTASLAAALRGAEFALPTPGLGDDHDFFAAARSAGVQVASEFDLATMWDDRPAIAVTGTDGKTTVVTLIERMLEASGVAAAAVGNTDTPWVQAIDDPRPQVFVVEASSFRLGHSRRFSPAVAAWLNFGPDHLDAHRDLAAYEQAKASIWSHLEPDALALANRDDRVVLDHARRITRGQVATFGLEPAAAGLAAPHRLDGNMLVVDDADLVDRSDLARDLPHDISNAMVAAAAAARLGAEPGASAQVLREFDGLAHRLETILEHGGVRWVNDSKATTPHAAAAGLIGFDSVVLIAGGRNKGLSFETLTARGDKLRHVVALGEAAPVVAAAFDGVAPVTTVAAMTEAVEAAAQAARPGDVVLLSPACASFDLYDNYRRRGEHFAALVRERFEEAS